MKTSRIAHVVATFFGSGLVPRAPGTAGSLAAIPLIIATQLYFSIPFQVAFWVFVLALGTWASNRVCEQYNESDVQIIVIDEVLGMAITCWGVGADWVWLTAGFFAFRAFDILKLPPVRMVDRWSKRLPPRQAGFGVIADDLLAGIQGLLVVSLIRMLLA